jgi:hypothetical protein
MPAEKFGYDHQSGAKHERGDEYIVKTKICLLGIAAITHCNISSRMTGKVRLRATSYRPA